MINFIILNRRMKQWRFLNMMNDEKRQLDFLMPNLQKIVEQF